MAPGEGGAGGGNGGNNGDGIAIAPLNGGSSSGAAAPVSAAAPPQPPPPRGLGGFKIKVKLPPRQPSGDGASVGGGLTVPMTTDANTAAAAAASLKRSAEGPPPEVAGATGPPQKLKITLKGIKIGGAARTTPQGPTPLSPGSGATSPVFPAPAAAAPAAPSSGGGGGGGVGGGSSKPKRLRSAKPPPAAVAFAAAAPTPPAAPLYGDDAGVDSDAAVPWADEVGVVVAAAAPAPAPTTAAAAKTATAKKTSIVPPPFIPAQQPLESTASKQRAAEDKGRASRSEASPGPSSIAAAAAAAAGGGDGGGSSRKGVKASKSRGRASSFSRTSEEKDRSGRGGEGKRENGAEEDENENGNDDGDGENESEYPLPKLHPTRSATREAVIRISDAVDPTVPEVTLDRNQAILLIEKVAKRDKEGVFREVPPDSVAPGYSRLIRRRVAFSTIRARAASGVYRAWDDLCEDLDTMLDNCRAYNGPDSPWGIYADSFQLAAARMLQLSRAGVTDLRGKTGNLFTLKQGGGGGDGSGDEAGAVGVAGGVGRYFRDASYTGGDRGGGGGGERGGERGAATNTAAPSLYGYGARARMTGRGGAGLLRSLRADAEAARDGLPRRLDDDGNWLEWRFANKRASYPARIGGGSAASATAAAAASNNGNSNNDSGDSIAAAAGGLARGHNGDGHALLGALTLLPSYVGAPPSDAYARSVARFAAGLKGKARQRALAVAAASLPSAGGGGGGRQRSARPSPARAAKTPPMPMTA